MEACLSERPVHRQAGVFFFPNVNIIQIYGEAERGMVAEGMEGQILFMSLKCTQAKMFTPEPQQQQQHSENLLRNEQKIESQDSSFFFPSPFFVLLLNIKAIYKLILLAHKVLLSSGA